MNIVIEKSNLFGKLNVNSSKSIAHRAILSSLVAKTEVTIKNINLCDDVENTINIVRLLTDVIVYNDQITIKPINNVNLKEINIEESLSTFNFLFPFITYYSNDEVIFNLGEKLSERIGKEYESLYINDENQYFIRKKNKIIAKGFPLKKEMFISNEITSQCASGIIFLMSSINKEQSITVDTLNSISYIDETIDVLKSFGIDVYRKNKTIFVMHNQKNVKCEYFIPDDGSDFLFKYAINHLFKNTTLNKPSCDVNDPDYLLFSNIVKNETIDDEIDLSNNPDAIFALSLFAIKKNSPTKFVNIERLKNKESNRIDSTENILNLFGFKTEKTSNSLTIYPGLGHIATVDAYNDHRICQFATILASLYGGTITNIDCVSKSSPFFFEELKENGLIYKQEPIYLRQKSGDRESQIIFSENTTLVKKHENTRNILITDKNVFKIYKEEIKKTFPNAQIYITKRCREKIKSINEYKKLCSYLIKNRISKSDYLIAFGGGTITDLVGYVSSTFKRGINMISIPTSLIAMVDASIGFKTALNLKSTKNVIGSFCVPEQILINTSYLKTLPEKEIKSGMAEIIKIFALRSEKYFNKVFVENKDKNLSKWILEAIILKLDIVNEDPYDKSLRHCLNFGHTYGHAFELYNKISHGEAVAMGMRICSGVKDLHILLDRYSFVKPTEKQIQNAKKHIYNDKKIENGVLKLVKVNKIGEFVIEEEKI